MLAEDSLRDAVAVGMKGAWRSLTGSMRALEVLQLLLRMQVSRTSLKLAWGEVPILCSMLTSLPGCSCSKENHSASLRQWHFMVSVYSIIVTSLLKHFADAGMAQSAHVVLRHTEPILTGQQT